MGFGQLPPAAPLELEPPAATMVFSSMTNLKSSADVPHVVGIEPDPPHVHEPTTDARPNGVKTPR